MKTSQHSKTNWIQNNSSPSKSQIEHAGPGIMKRNDKTAHPHFVNLFHHTVSETCAIYIILCLVAAVFLVPFFVLLFVQAVKAVALGHFSGNIDLTLGFLGLELLLIAALGVGFFTLAWRMLFALPKGRLHICEAMIVCVSLLILCHLALFGVNTRLVLYGLDAALLVALHSYWDPELALERANKTTEQESLKEMIFGSKDERTVIPGKKAGKGYITLNFFNLFWIFTICSIVGLCVETVFFWTTHGYYQDRAGMLWGPLSPIYGFGGTLMTIALNRFHNKSPLLIFIISALIGGAFEYFTSWFMQTAFGVIAWDYSGTFLNIDGRTNLFFMCCWGILGLVWIKLLLPIMFYFIKKIPWGWRYTLTTICAILMIADGVFTLTTIDCWYLREAGQPQTTAIEKFCAVHFDDEYMQNRFQTMTMDVHDTARTTGLDG